MTFSSLATYSRYRIVSGGLVASSGTTTLRINGDSGTNYNFVVPAVFNPTNAPYSPPTPTVLATSITISNVAGINPVFDFQIDNALLPVPKTINGWGHESSDSANATSGRVGGILNGLYVTTSAITSITINRSASFTSGIIYLLGAN